MKQQALTNDARHILAVDPAGEATTVATGPMRVSDLAQITVRDYPGLRVEDAVRRFIADETVKATDVTVAQAVTEPDTTTPTRTRLHAKLQAVLGDVSIGFCDRRDAQVRAWLTGAPEVPAVAGAVLSTGDYSRDVTPTVDQPTVEALLAWSPAGFERWVVTEVGGTPSDWLEGDQGIDGVIRSRDYSGQPVDSSLS